MKKIFSLLAAVLFAGSMMAASATMQYSGSTTTNMDTVANNAATLGLDANLFTVSALKGANQNAPGLNKAGDIRLYADKTNGNGNSIIVTIANGTIDSIALDIKAAATYEVKAGATAVTGTNDVFAINATSFSIQNITTGANTQLQLNKITIHYTAEGGEPVEPGDEPVAEEAVVYNWAKDAANQVGTTILAEAGVAVSTVKIHTNTDAVDCLNFSKSLKTDSFYVAIKPAEGSFKAGDVLHIACCYSNTAEKRAAIKVLAANWTDSLYCTANGINGRLVNDNPVEETYTLAADQDSLILGRYGNTGTCVTLLKVVRPAAQEEPVLADPTNCAEAAAAALSVAKNNELYNGGKEYTIQGYVTEIAYEYSETSKNMSFWMADAINGGKIIEAYKCAVDSAKNAPKLDDLVKVTGKLTKYNTTPEFAPGCTVEIIERAPEVVPADADTVSVAEAIVATMALDSSATSRQEYVIMGYVVDAQDFSWGSKQQIFFLVDDTANTAGQIFEAYYCTAYENGEATPVLNGDKIYLKGKLTKYYDTKAEVPGYLPELKNGTAEFISKVEGDRSQPAAPEITVAKALQIGGTLEQGATGDTTYSVVGYVTDVITAWNASSKQVTFWMADAANGGKDKATAFEVYKGTSEEEITVGCKVSVYTKIKNYNGTIESETGALVTLLESMKIDTINVATAVDLALKLEDNAKSAKNYVVVGYVVEKGEYNTSYNNISFYLVDDDPASADRSFQVFRANMTQAEADALQNGDFVIVTGYLKNYLKNGENFAQMDAGATVEVLWKQALEQIVLTEKVNKVIMNGVIYIVRDGKLYNLQGAQVR